MRDALQLDSAERDTVAFAGEVGRACPLPQAMPVIFHICRHASTYRDAVERNILAGGDNCGRAPIIGAVFGAASGVQGDGIPVQWLARLNDGARIAGEIDTMLEHLT
jgi:ADP-ribosylglycohydrolase